MTLYPVTPTPTENHLIRGLGLLAATSIVIGDVIGTGVFLKARVMTCNVGTPGMVITVWIVAGLFSLATTSLHTRLTNRQGRGNLIADVSNGKHRTTKTLYSKAFLYCSY
jgi:hypothetical protein